jgi:opacity protein-like surface antigen
MRASGLRGRAARCCAVLSFAAVVAAFVGVALAHDGDEPRGYLGFRGFGSNPGTGVHDYWGASLGGNFNRYLGGELSLDAFERRIHVDGFSSVGEYSITALVPQVRLRYPLFEGRLTPYFVAGAGVAFGEFNDRKAGTFGKSVDADRTMPVGTVGGGIEYFLSDTVAVGVEVKYLFAGTQDVRIDGVSHSNSIDSLFASFALRMFYPERPTAPPLQLQDGPLRRLYLALHLGGAIVTDPRVSSELEARPEPPAIGPLNQYFGGAVGLDFGRYLGVEVTFEGYETTLELKGVGSIAEYAVYAVVPQARLRYPLLEGRLVPYLLAGVGLASAEVNDRKPKGAGVQIQASDFGLAVTVGGGLEYLLTRNIAVGLETKYLYTHGLTLKLAGGATHEANLGPVFVSLGLRVYLADF